MRSSRLAKRGRISVSLLRLFSSLLVVSFLLVPAGALAAPNAVPANAAVGCQLNSVNGDIQHVIYLIFDNTHFLRDNPNVPSDLEQMPHLLNFIRDNGTLLTNNHTVLISHTANGIVTSFTGLYPDRHGQAVTNSYRYFKADGTTASSSSFKYWTDLVDDTGVPPADPLPNMVNGDSGTPKTTPAPWVPYTRAGCDFGAVASANIVLENTGTGPSGDITKVFGVNSPEWLEAKASSAQAQADFVGFAIHCGAGGGLCANNPNARPDLLPDESGGYNGYLGLFGAKYINPVITGGSAVVSDLNGNPITDAVGRPGFPGFDGLFAATTLSYVAQMQETGIPVTFGYISDAHDNHGNAGSIHIAYGPGEPGYVAQLQAYDQAFAIFFDRLAADGINKSNTLFVITNEEGDHFVGSQPSPAGCDGINTPCSYSTVSEINGNLTGLLATQQGITTPFTVHSDMAPTIYITGNPARTDTVTRDFGRALGQLTAVSPLTGQTDTLAVALADPVGMKALHMVTADPQRTPTLVMFAHPDYFFTTGPQNCSSPCIFIPSPSNFTFAWNHGGIQPEIATTWLGMVGPGVAPLGTDSTTWADHADGRPTMLTLVGLKDTYIHDGRILTEILEDSAIPSAVKSSDSFIALAQMYKQINAPFGQFAMDSLVASTKAIKSGSASDDGVYTTIEDKIDSWTGQRNEVATKMRALLENAAFNGQTINSNKARSLIKQGQTLLDKMHALATAP